MTKEVMKKAEQFVASLKPVERTVFVLRVIEGYEEDEISDMLGDSVAKVRRSLKAATRKLLTAPDEDVKEFFKTYQIKQQPSANVAEVLETIRTLTPDLILHLKKNEDDLLKVNPRVFEHLIAEFFASWGFDDVRLVGTNARTSADIYVVKTVNPVGVENRYFIEVKRWKHKVGIEVINQVLGAMIGEREQFGWHAAMIVSVAGFTEFEKWDRQQLKMKGIELKDKSDLLRWLQNYKPSGNGLWLPEPPTLL